METTIDLVHDTQKTFRSITKAMSYPGRIIALEADAQAHLDRRSSCSTTPVGADLFGRRGELLL
jgi:alpha-D-ribose 1-methylphosphonate 5-triphosphate synthase subunit PhnH